MTAEVEVVTVRKQLLGSLVDFLKVGGMGCGDTADMLTTMAMEIVGYREEGVQLFPLVCVCDNLAAVIGAAQHFVLGSGGKSPETAIRALKACAPLARGGWSIFLERTHGKVEYGVFRMPYYMLAARPEDIVEVTDSSSTRLCILRPLSGRSVEIISDSGASLILNLGSGHPTKVTLPAAVDSFSELCVSRVNDALREPVRRFLRGSLLQALQRSHGALLAVLAPDTPKPAWEGVWLPKALDLVAEIANYEAAPDQLTTERVGGLHPLVGGMVSSDGITIFSTDGQVLAYRVFVQISSDYASEGGARSRAFRALIEASSTKIAGVLKCSQDGEVEFRNNE